MSAHVVFAGSTDRPTDRPTDPAWAAAAGWIRSARPEHRFRRAPRGPRYRTVRSSRGTCRELARATSAPFDSLVAPPATARHDERSPTCFACGPVRICQTATADSHRRPVCIRVIPHVANTRVGIQPSSNARRQTPDARRQTPMYALHSSARHCELPALKPLPGAMRQPAWTVRAAVQSQSVTRSSLERRSVWWGWHSELLSAGHCRLHRARAAGTSAIAAGVRWSC